VVVVKVIAFYPPELPTAEEDIGEVAVSEIDRASQFGEVITEGVPSEDLAPDVRGG
jgi:hypothetical protein